MTDTTTTTVEPAGEPPPFLRITATYPTAGGRTQTVDVCLNLRDDDTVLETDDDASTGAAMSWLNDFVATTVTALRGRPAPTVVLGGKALAALFTDQVRHAEDCNGECGIETPTAGDVPADERGN